MELYARHDTPIEASASPDNRPQASDIPPVPLEAQADYSSVLGLVNSWELHLRSVNLSPKTIRSYLDAVRKLGHFLAETGMPTEVLSLTREHVESFIVSVLNRTSAVTAATYYRSLQQFFKWLVEEGEIEANPMARMKPPKAEEKLIPIIPDRDLQSLLTVCSGRDFESRRDTAIVRLFLATGARLAEIAEITLDHVDLPNGEIRVLGKGRKERTLWLGGQPKALKTIDRYLRARALHKDAAQPWLWLGPKGKLTHSGIAQMLRRRSHQAGIEPVHPHQFRHTYAHRFLAQGGNEGDLMHLAGWRSAQMLQRYARSAATERAKAAQSRIAPGEDL